VKVVLHWGRWQGDFGGQRIKMVGSAAYVTMYIVQIKVPAAKFVFVRFWGRGKAHIWGQQLPQPPWLRASAYRYFIRKRHLEQHYDRLNTAPEVLNLWLLSPP